MLVAASDEFLTGPDGDIGEMDVVGGSDVGSPPANSRLTLRTKTHPCACRRPRPHVPAHPHRPPCLAPASVNLPTPRTRDHAHESDIASVWTTPRPLLPH